MVKSMKPFIRSHAKLHNKFDAFFNSGGVNKRFATNCIGSLTALRKRKKSEKLTSAQIKRRIEVAVLKYANPKLIAMGKKLITVEEALAWVVRKD